MMKKSKWMIAIAGALMLAGAGFMLVGHSGESSTGQRVNAVFDDLQAVGIRVLDLPLFMLLGTAAGVGIGSAFLIERLSGQRVKAGRVALVSGLILTLFGLAFAADRRDMRLQTQISELRGKLTAQRMTMPEPSAEPAAVLAVPVRDISGTARTAATTALATPRDVAEPAITPPAPAAVIAKISLNRDKLLIDPDVIKNKLTSNFMNPTLRPVILDRATDAVELRITNPQVVAYISITDLKAPGVEIQYGGNVGTKTFTSDFAKTNDCAVAINGEAGQSPQANSGLGLWYGNMMSAGKLILKEGANNPRPFLTFDKESQPLFTAQVSKERAIAASAYNVVWGRMDAIIDGAVQTAAERDRQPRTAMGISKDGTRLVLMVVDGRQQQYSVGVTRAEVGMLLNAFGAANGMLCDEGGSSCMYLKKFSSVINSPSDGEERATYTHFGVTLHNPAVP